VLRGTLKLPKDTTLDAADAGLRVLVAAEGASESLVDERVAGFVAEDPETLVYTGDGTGAVEAVRLETQPRNRVGIDTTIVLGDAMPPRLVLGLDGGAACARRTLRCKTKRGVFACR
jgi:hypothetical protein